MKRAWSLLWAARLVAKWEGFSSRAYLDTIAVPPVPTIGYGHTRGVVMGMRWSRAKALRVLARDLRYASRVVAKAIHVPLAVRQRMALIDAVHNCGPGIVEGSTLQRKLNAGDYQGAADELLNWVHAGGRVVEGLVNRRRDERWMFMHPRRRSKVKPVARISTKGELAP